MANILEQFFVEALSRIPSHSALSDEGVPEPEDPEWGEVDRPIASEEDVVIASADIWRQTQKARQLFEQGTGISPYRALDPDERHLLDGGVREAGLDVYAFYKSRRHIKSDPFAGKWGIFYLEQGVARIRELIEATYPSYGNLELAYEFLREHERFHFKFDLYALSVEAIQGRRLYDPLKQAFRHRRIHKVEEALANRDAWEWARSPRIGLGDFAHDFMKLQPGAYARFDENRHHLAGELAANLLDLNVSGSTLRNDQALWVGIVPGGLLRRSLCPEYVVRPAALSAWISPAHKLPEVREVRDAKPVADLLISKYADLRERWHKTKDKLIQNPGLPSLDFKLWDKKTGHWSVRVTDNFRAHLHRLPNSPGLWEADEFGPHKAMGHG